MQSPFSERLILKAMKKILSRVHSEELNLSIDTLVDKIFEKGNFEKADLLA